MKPSEIIESSAYTEPMDNRRIERDQPTGMVAVAAGPITALAVAGLTSRFRDSFGVANVVLVLAVIVVAAAVAGRVPGIVTAITAAVAFNFFDTAPFRSLRIHGTQDIITVAMLVVLGISISEFSAGRRRSRRAATRRLQGARALESVTALLADNAAPHRVWETIQRAMIDQIGLIECRFESGSTTTLPTLPRSATLVGPHARLGREGLMLPEEGIAVPVTSCGTVYGHIVMIPDSHLGSPLESRQLAIALADDYAVALRMHAAV